MTRNTLLVIGAALLSIGGIGIIVGLAWLTASRVHETLPYIFDAHAEMLLYILPALLLMIAVAGAAFVASGFAAPAAKDPTVRRHLRLHTRFHG